jgi:predicted SAM-dependent methyltransferase
MSFRNFIKSYSPAPVIDAAKCIRRLGRMRSSRQLVRELLDAARPIRLELGSGDKKGVNGWTTLDVAPGCDMYCNLARGIPFPDNSVQDIYSSHFFEHLAFKETQVLLDECMRVMVTGGRFSICVPNAKLYLRAYLNDDIAGIESFFVYKPAYNHTTRIDYVNYVAYMDGQHKYMFDEDNLVHILKEKGFKNVRIRPFDADLDLQARDYESIYAEGYK